MLTQSVVLIQLSFASGQAGLIFDVFANKRRTPMKFDPTFTDASDLLVSGIFSVRIT